MIDKASSHRQTATTTRCDATQVVKKYLFISNACLLPCTLKIANKCFSFDLSL